MKKYVFLILVVFTNFNVFSQSNFKIRGLDWNVSLNNILTSEGKTNDIKEYDIRGYPDGLYKKTEITYYNKEVSNYKALLQYTLVLDKLIYVYYSFDDIYTYNVITIFNDLKNKLTELYGNYDQEKRNLWKSVSKLYFLENLTSMELIKLLDDGKQIFDKYIWIYNGTRIELNVISSLNKTWNITIEYTAPNFDQIVDEALKNNKNNKKGL
jgi:hypothetical protein